MCISLKCSSVCTVCSLLAISNAELGCQVSSQSVHDQRPCIVKNHPVFMVHLSVSLSECCRHYNLAAVSWFLYMNGLPLQEAKVSAGKQGV